MQGASRVAKLGGSPQRRIWWSVVESEILALVESVDDHGSQPEAAVVCECLRCLDDLVDRVTVQETAFFRHPEHFAVLASDVLPTLPRPVRCKPGCW